MSINVKQYLTEKQYQDYLEYQDINHKAQNEGWHHWCRIYIARYGGILDYKNVEFYFNPERMKEAGHEIDQTVKMSWDEMMERDGFIGMSSLIEKSMVDAYGEKDGQKTLIMDFDRVSPVEINHCVPYENPHDLDGTCPVMHPSGRFIAELMHGSIHPPITAHWNRKLLLVAESGKYEVVDQIDAAEWRAKNGPIKHEVVVENRECHLKVEQPLTYDEAIEYCIMKDIPRQVWDQNYTGSNRQKFWIIEREDLMGRELRNSWTFKEAA
jgi:hypothetical protein